MTKSPGTVTGTDWLPFVTVIVTAREVVPAGVPAFVLPPLPLLLPPEPPPQPALAAMIAAAESTSTKAQPRGASFRR